MLPSLAIALAAFLATAADSATTWPPATAAVSPAHPMPAHGGPPLPRCAESGLPARRPPWAVSVPLGNGAAALEVLFDRDNGRITVCAVEKPGERPLRLRPDVMALYVGGRSSTVPVRIFLDPVEIETDELGQTWARRFSGESPALRGAAGFDATLSLLIVHGAPFRAVGVHVGANSSSSRGK